MEPTASYRYIISQKERIFDHLLLLFLHVKKLLFLLVADLFIERISSAGHDFCAERSHHLIVTGQCCGGKSSVLMRRNCSERLHISKFIFRDPPHT